jgi:hypothetical protein
MPAGAGPHYEETAHRADRFDVFLSHHNADTAVVEEIAEVLRRSGIEPWLDSWHLPAGVRWQPKVADALAACASCAVFVGPASVGAWGHQELEVALERASKDPEFRVFLVLLPGGPDPSDAAGLSPFISTRTWVDLRHGLDGPDALAPLVNAVKGLPPRSRWLPGAAVPSVERAVGAAPRPSLPSRLSTAGRTRFVGREQALERLRHALAQASDGARAFVLVEGEPGIGKTRLLAEFARLAQGEALALYGRCPEESLAAYQPFIEAIGQYVATAPRDALRAELGASGGELIRLLPALARRFPGLPHPARGDPEGERFRLFEAVDLFLTATARSRPIVLIIDDLHWADRPSILLLGYLARAVGPARVLLVASRRDTERARTEALEAALADLELDEGVNRLEIMGLTAHEISALVSGSAGMTVAQSVARAVFERTAGNPFFAGELLQNLKESGIALSSDDTAVENAGIPRGVKQAVARRLGRLSAGVQHVLSLAALLGRDFDLEILVQVSDLPPERLVDVLDEALAAGLLVETSDLAARYSFRHSLITETLVDQLTAARRAQYHEQIAAGLEAHGSETHFAELARHLLAAAPLTGNAGRARAYAFTAAERAAARLAHDEAARLLQLALSALELESRPSEQDRCDVLLALGDAQLHAGDSERARGVFADAARSARKLHDPHRLAQAALGTARGRPRSVLGAPDEGAIAVLEEALAALGAENSALHARVLSRLATEHYWTLDRRRAGKLAREAESMAHHVGDADALASALHAAYVLEDHPDGLVRRAELAGEMRQLADRCHDPRILLSAQHFTLIEAIEQGDIVRADAALAGYVEGAVRLRHPMHRWHATMWTAMRHLLAGRFDETERSVREAHAAGQHAQDPNVLQTVAVQLAHLRWEQGRTDEILAPLRAAIDRDRAIPAWRAVLATAHAELDNREQAHELFESLALNDFEALPRDATWLGALALLAEICRYLDDTSRAATIGQLLEPYADRVIIVGNARVCMGSASHYIGVLAAARGAYSDAERRFQASIAVDTRLGAAARLARTKHAYAHVLLARNEPGDAGQARELLDEARAAAQELGMQRLLADLRLAGTPSRAYPRPRAKPRT